MTVSLIAISSSKDDGLKTRTNVVGKKKTSPSHHFSTLLSGNTSSSDHENTVHTSSVQENEGRHTLNKNNNHHSNKESVSDRQDNISSLQGDSEDKNTTINDNEYPSSKNNISKNINNHDDDIHDDKDNHDLKSSGQLQNLYADITSVALNEEQTISEDGLSPTSLQTLSPSGEGTKNKADLSGQEDIDIIPLTDDKKPSVPSLNANKIQKDGPGLFADDYLKNNNVSIAHVSLDSQETLAQDQGNLLSKTQHEHPRSDNKRDVTSDISVKNLPIHGLDDDDVHADSEKNIKNDNIIQQGHKVKLSQSPLDQSDLPSRDTKNGTQRLSDKGLLFNNVKKEGHNASFLGDNASQNGSNQADEKDKKSLFSETIEGHNIFAEGSLKQEHSHDATSSAPVHNDMGMNHMEAEHNLFPKTAHIPSTLNMTVTTADKASVHVQLTRLEDHLATLSLQGTDETTTEILKKTRHDLISHLDEAGVQPAGIKIAVLPTDTSNMSGEKGQGSFDNGAAFSGFSEQRQSQHNPTQQEWSGGVLNSVETADSPVQNEKGPVAMEQGVPATHSLLSDVTRRGINISV